jgi:hypothetical protein
VAVKTSAMEGAAEEEEAWAWVDPREDTGAAPRCGSERNLPRPFIPAATLTARTKIITTTTTVVGAAGAVAWDEPLFATDRLAVAATCTATTRTAAVKGGGRAAL